MTARRCSSACPVDRLALHLHDTRGRALDNVRGRASSTASRSSTRRRAAWAAVRSHRGRPGTSRPSRCARCSTALGIEHGVDAARVACGGARPARADDGRAVEPGSVEQRLDLDLDLPRRIEQAGDHDHRARRTRRRRTPRRALGRPRASRRRRRGRCGCARRARGRRRLRAAPRRRSRGTGAPARTRRTRTLAAVGAGSAPCPRRSTCRPATIAREKPISGSNGEPDETRRRSPALATRRRQHYRPAYGRVTSSGHTLLPWCMALTAEAEYVLRTIEERGIRFVRLWFTDVLGFLKSFTITSQELEGAFAEGMGFDGSSIEGFSRIQESDMIAIPDPATFQVIPWKLEAPVARMFCDIWTPDGAAVRRRPARGAEAPAAARGRPGLHVLRRSRARVLLLPLGRRSRRSSTRAATSTRRRSTSRPTTASARCSTWSRWASRSSTCTTRSRRASTRSTCATPTRSRWPTTSWPTASR